MQRISEGQNPHTHHATVETGGTPTLRPTVASCLSVACLRSLSRHSSSFDHCVEDSHVGVAARVELTWNWLLQHVQIRLERHYRKRLLTAEFETSRGQLCCFPTHDTISISNSISSTSSTSSFSSSISIK